MNLQRILSIIINKNNVKNLKYSSCVSHITTYTYVAGAFSKAVLNMLKIIEY
jgi:hypothetical protein